jgi:hypothetical protein
MADRQTERDGRDEQNTTIPSEDPQNKNEGKGRLSGCAIFFFSFCFLFFSSLVKWVWVWVWEGLGRQIYPWDRALCFLMGLGFGDLFIHT